jgi:hypothetical protein
LHAIAVSLAGRQRGWATVSYKDRKAPGLHPAVWCGILDRPRLTPFVPLATCWIGIEGQLWQCAFYNGGDTDSDKLKAQFKHLQAALRRFEFLAREACSHFGEKPQPKLADPFLQPKLEHRWLETLFRMPFVEREQSDPMFLERRLIGSVFMNSALAIEHLAQNGGALTEGIDGIAGGADPAPAALSKPEAMVLRKMVDAAPVLCTVDKLEGTGKERQGRGTVTKAVNSLIEAGYAHRPKGLRQGATATEKGKLALGSNAQTDR